MKPQFPRCIPNGARKIETPADLPVEVYALERDGYFQAIAWRGKSTTPAFFYRFPTSEKRDAYVSKWVSDEAESHRVRSEFKAKRAAEKKAFRHDFKVGEVLHSSWGYEQTNVEFYEIVAISEKQVSFREVAQRRERTGHDSGRCYPIKGEYLNDKVYTRTVKAGYNGGRGSVAFAEYQGGYQKHLSISEDLEHGQYFSDGY